MKRNALEQCSYGLYCPTGGNFCRVFGELGALDVLFRYIGEQETLENYSGYQGETEHFWCFEQASRTHQVLEATSSVIPSVVQASGRLVSTFSEYQELIYAPWGIFIVDQLG